MLWFWSTNLQNVFWRVAKVTNRVANLLSCDVQRDEPLPRVLMRCIRGTQSSFSTRHPATSKWWDKVLACLVALEYIAYSLRVYRSCKARRTEKVKVRVRRRGMYIMVIHFLDKRPRCLVYSTALSSGAIILLGWNPVGHRNAGDV